MPAPLGLQPMRPENREELAGSAHHLDDNLSPNAKNVPWDTLSTHTSGSATSSSRFASHSDLSILSSKSVHLPDDSKLTANHVESDSEDDKESRRDLKFWRFATKKKAASPRILSKKASHESGNAPVGLNVLKKKYKSTSDMARLARAPPPPLPGKMGNEIPPPVPEKPNGLIAISPVPFTPISLFQTIPTDVNADDAMNDVAVPSSVSRDAMILTANFFNDNTAELQALRRIPYQTKPALWKPDPSVYLAPPASAPVIGYSQELHSPLECKKSVTTPKSNRHARWYGKGKFNYDASDSFLDL